MLYNDLRMHWYLHSLNRWESFQAGEETKPMLMKLAEILDRLEPQGDDNLHTIWVKTKRPTFRQFYDYHYEYDEPYKEASEERKRDITKEYEEEYPTSKVWHSLSVKHFDRKNEEPFYGMFLDYHYLFSINDCNDLRDYDDPELFHWALEEASAFVEEVEKGTYKENILDKIPECYRFGTITRSDLWDADPESRKHFFSYYKMKEIKKFCSVFKTDEIVNPMVKEMTARLFYEACGTIYAALKSKKEVRTYKYEETEEERKKYSGLQQTPKEMYYANADGRDNGLKNVPMDDPKAFEEWDSGKGPFYEFNGSHPWEIIPSFSISFSMHLYPHKSESGEWYFILSGESYVRSPETIIAANALYDAGYPICVYGRKEIMDRINGQDEITVIPSHTMVSFSNEDIHLPKGEIGIKVAKKMKWDFDQYEMKKGTN